MSFAQEIPGMSQAIWEVSVHFLDNAIAAMFVSFMVGVLVDPVLRRFTVYRWLSTRYLFVRPVTYENLGVLWFRQLLMATPLRWFNPNIRITNSRDLESVRTVRQHMASAEISHWVGFATMLGMTIVAWWYRGATIGLAYGFFNIVGNLYPCLLQQYNKRRICQLIDAMEKRDMANRVDSR